MSTSARPTVEQLTERISAAIMSGDLPVGTWLRQEALAEEYGVSRQPVREALRQLQAAGMLENYRHRGAYVKGPSPREIREAYLVRAELEGLAAELAARRAEPAQLARLADARQELRRVTERVLQGDEDQSAEQWAVANNLFHEIVVEAAAIEILRQSIQSLHRIVPRNLTWHSLASSAMLERNTAEHAAIADAIEAGDAVAARRAMAEHVRNSGDLIASWLEQRQRVAGSPEGFGVA